MKATDLITLTLPREDMEALRTHYESLVAEDCPDDERERVERIMEALNRVLA